MSEQPEANNYDDAVLQILAYELSPLDRTEIDAKLTKKLKRYKLGGFDDARIERLRRFKDEVQFEVQKGQQSKYYTFAHGQPSDRGAFADHRDFDADRMVLDFANSFPELSQASIQHFIEYAIFLYYLR